MVIKFGEGRIIATEIICSKGLAFNREVCAACEILDCKAKELLNADEEP